VREHRLYQADWLMRHYGFAPGELTTADEPNLDLHIDPKTAWAVRHPAAFPVDVNSATREQLLRVPGFGRKTVDRLLVARRQRRIGVAELRKLRARLSLARPFVVASDWRPRSEAATLSLEPVQAPLFA
jgi:predicted DNA-binding helix-hairpin-helix protein